MSVSAGQILEKFSDLLIHQAGDLETVATHPSTASIADKGSLLFVHDRSDLAMALQSQAAIIAVADSLINQLPSDADSRCILKSPNVKLAMSYCLQEFFPLPFFEEPFSSETVHPTAVIHPTSEVDPSTVIGPHVTIDKNCKIGPGGFIGANTYIGPQSTIGAHCEIHPQVYIGHNCHLGDRCKVFSQSAIGSEGYGYADDEKFNHIQIPHYGKVILKDDVHIGSGVMLDRGTFDDSVIGEGTKVDNYCHFGHNIRTGKNCLITAGFISAGSVTIGDNCVFGGRTTVSGHLSITDNVQVAGLSGVQKGIDRSGAYGGYPIIPLKKSLKAIATIPHLSEMRKQLTRLLNKLESDDRKSSP